MVACPACQASVKESNINRHLDSECKLYIDDDTAAPPSGTQFAPPPSTAKKPSSNRPTAADFFTPSGGGGGGRRTVSFRGGGSGDDYDSGLGSSPVLSSTSGNGFSSTQHTGDSQQQLLKAPPGTAPASAHGVKRPAPEQQQESETQHGSNDESGGHRNVSSNQTPATKKAKKLAHAPLAERMRPSTLDEVAGQELVGPDGVLRNLILTDRVPSMILWGGPGTGKTTIARLIAQTAGTRFVEINSTSSGVAECKKLFGEAKNELNLTGRKTIIFCDEIHRFSKSQQDVFLGPVEAGQVTLIGATTENPSFKVVNALLSRCRTFTLSKLSDEDVFGILRRAMAREIPGDLPTPSSSPSPAMDEDKEQAGSAPSPARPSYHLLTDDDHSLVHYLASFADGDARTGLNLLELALDLCQRPSATIDDIKKSLTQTLVYDRAGDQHYDTISAFHKSVRGSNADAALYYLARMLQSGEDPLYVARRMVVIASEDVGLADNSMLSLATATYTAAEKIGMPECRINLAHCTVALCLAPKSVRAYRGLNAAYAALNEPGIAGLPVPIHLRNAPTKLMKELGYGKEYKYNPNYKDGRVVQDYLPEKLSGREFLGARNLGTEIDPEIAELDSWPEDAEDPDSGGNDEEVLLGPDGD